MRGEWKKCMEAGNRSLDDKIQGANLLAATTSGKASASDFIKKKGGGRDSAGFRDRTHDRDSPRRTGFNAMQGRECVLGGRGPLYEAHGRVEEARPLPRLLPFCPGRRISSGVGMTLKRRGRTNSGG